MQGLNGSMTLNMQWNSRFFATPSSIFRFTVDPTNNLPAVLFDNSTYESTKKMDLAYKVATYTAYSVLLFGMACDKVIGVELFGVLQLAHLVVSDMNAVQPLLSPLMNLSMVNGYNPTLFP